MYGRTRPFLNGPQQARKLLVLFKVTTAWADKEEQNLFKDMLPAQIIRSSR